MITELKSIFGTVEKSSNFWLFQSTDRSERPFVIGEQKDLRNGDFVELDIQGKGSSKEFVIVKNHGEFSIEKLNEVIVREKYGIPYKFGTDVAKECKSLPNFAQEERVDLCTIPFVTIDGDDSKDFDDAVYAKRTDDGFEIMVAIADVSFYVRSDTALDKEAYLRGNSVYLPQMVIPMLPEILSNDLCSLNPKVKRPALVCFMNIDKSGTVVDYRFEKAVIKSAARLTYKEVNNAIDGQFNEQTKKIWTSVLQPIYEAYFALNKARMRRGALNIEGREVKIKFDKAGHILSIYKYEVLTSHKIIEEFMVTANVAAAMFLGKHKIVSPYRIHDKPLEEKLADIKPVLKQLHLRLPDYGALKPEHLNKLLNICHTKQICYGIDDMVLRLQCQAKYNPKNIGHFGLGLTQYVHFTSPIRRYADLLVHRGILEALKIGNQAPTKLANMELICEHISSTERRAVNAERDVTARYIAMYLKPMVGMEFELKISGFNNAGIFVNIPSLGADGLIPMRSLPSDYYQLMPANSGLKGRRNRLEFSLGEDIKATLKEATPITGGLIFNYIPLKVMETKQKKTKQRLKKKGHK